MGSVILTLGRIVSQNLVRRANPMWKLIQGEPDTVIRWCGPFLLTAMIGLFLTTRFDIPGVISCFFLGSLGSAGGLLLQYRNDRGLWMLAVLLLLVYSMIYAMIIIGQIQDIMRNAAQPPIGLTIDFTIGTALLVTNLRFLFRAARYNWTMSREPIDA